MFADEPTGSGDNSFKGGTKEDTVDPNTTTGSIPNNKSDLKHFGYFQENIDETHAYLHLMWTRVQDPSGTTLMDFELNKGEEGLYPETSNGDRFPVRMAGDLLIEYKLAQGGVMPELFLYEWLVEAADGACEASNSYPCWGNRTSLAGNAIGSINSSSADSDGVLDTNGNSLGTLDPYTFGEASIDLYASGIFTVGECASFGYASLKSRSSDSFSSQMKDYIESKQVNISNCANITVKKIDDSDPARALDKAEFTLYYDLGVQGEYEPGTDTMVPSSVITNPVETDVEGFAEWKDVFAGFYCVVETKAPTGYSKADPDWWCFELTADQSQYHEFVNPRIPGKINIDKTDETGVLLGNGWVFTLHEDNGGTPGAATAFSCTTTAGECTIQNILPPGTYCVVETTNPEPTKYGDADPQCGKDVTLGGELSLVFVNPRKPGKINIDKKDETGALLGNGWVFTLHEDNGGTPGAATAFSCTTTAGECTIENILPPGTYCVVETTNPEPTKYGDADPQCGKDVTLGGELSLVFVNPRKPGKINIDKKDETGALLGNGWVFTLHEDNGGTPGAATAFSCTTTAGECTIENILPPGTYCVVETTNPEPTKYGDADPQCGKDVTLGGELSLVFVNPRKPGKINIDKKDETGALLDNGWVFTLHEDNGGTPGAATAFSCTTTAGECTIENILPPGTYCVVETTNPEPTKYGDADPQCGKDVTLGGELSLTFVNPRLKGAILITKTRKHAADGAGDHPHEGITFTIEGGELAAGGVDVVTNASGEACYDGLLVSSLVGNYSVTETVPGGYVADGDESKDVSVTLVSSCDDGNEATVSFSNTPLTDITVSVDSQVDGGTASTIKCVKGTDPAAGDVVASGATAANGDGSATANDLLPGYYTCTIYVDP
ncbi:hypothetical protein GCM10009104_18150 [Marinobacterium maritimum]|uniref:SpaA-like prealbumin fold domain-containing protein n=1 Tax=Marinobacterium maritimum TaxID=500162 RepID=A0ABN1I662_9GAMM